MVRLNAIARKRRESIMLAALSLFAPGYVGATDAKFSEPVIESVSSIGIYYYAVRDYTPPVSVDPSRVSEWKTANSPEGVAYLQMSLMLQGDYKGWLASWDEQSRAIIENRNAERGRDAAYWVDRWKKGFSSYTKFYLTRRVDMAESVIVEFRASVQDNSTDDMFLDIPVKKGKNGKWYATQLLAKNPVLHHWRRPGSKTETVMSPPPKF